MKKLQACSAAIALLLLVASATAQNVAINTDGSLPDTNAILDIKSSNKGILIPRISSSVRLSIPASPGLLVYDNTTSSFWYYTGSSWQNLAADKSSWSFYGNDATDSSFIGTRNIEPLVFKVNNQPAGCIDLEGNVLLGSWAGNSNTTGYSNAAHGEYALFKNTKGNYNTSAGSFSLKNNILGNLNTAVGYDALFTNITGDYNTAIGANAGVASTSLTNATAIGAGAIVNTSNKVRIGNSNVIVIEGQVPFTTPSDGRFKFNVQEDVKGLAFITQLRPVTYQFDVKCFDAQQAHTDAATDNNIQWAGYNEASLMRRSGFIAQEVEKAAMASGYNFSGIIKPKTPQEHYGLSYESFVVPLVKAVQELSKQFIDLQNQLNALKQSQSNSK
jgi:hypothetical protein